MSAHEIRHGDYLITDDRAKLDAVTIHRYLSEESYWAKGITLEIVQRSLDHSLCIGVYLSAGKQVGLARVVTDYATFGWLCDVFVLPSYRGAGLGKALVTAVLSHPGLQTLRRVALGTLDAHALYAQFGFTPLAEPQRHMERRRQQPLH